MQTHVNPVKSTETRLEWWAYLFILDEFIAEADATINGPAAYNNEPLILSERDSLYFLSVMLEPPAPSEGLLSLFKGYSRSKE